MATGDKTVIASKNYVDLKTFEPTIKPTLKLDFANNEHSFYDGVENSFTQAPLDNIVTVSNGLANAYDARGRLAPVSANKPRLTFNPETGESEGLLVEEARTNLIEAPSRAELSGGYGSTGTAEVSVDVTTSPTGAFDADRISDDSVVDNKYWNKVCTALFVIDNYTGSVYVKKDTSDIIAVNVRVYGTTTNQITAYFRFSDEAVSGSMTKDYIGNGWYRLSITVANTDVANIYGRVLIYPATNFGSFDSALTGSVYVYHAQLEKGAFPTSPIPEASTFTSRASTGTYYDSTGTLQTSAINEARYTYNPADLTAPPVLMDEESRANFLLNSATATPNGTQNCTQTLVTDTSPIAGETQVRQVTVTGDDTTGNSYHLRLGVSSGAAVGEVYTGSIYIRSDSPVSLEIDTNDGGRVPYTTTTKWVRISAVSGNNTAYRFLDIRVGSGQIGAVFQLAGSQLEQGSYPTSYIPTTTSAVTRSADVVSYAQSTRITDRVYCDLSGYEFGEEFSIYYEGSANTEYQTVGTRGGFFNIHSSTQSMGLNSILIGKQTGSNVLYFRLFIDGDGIGYFPSNYVVGSELQKIVLTYKNEEYKIYANGNLLGTYAGGLPSDINKVLIGMDGFYKDGAETKDFKLYPKALSQAECIALTGGA